MNERKKGKETKQKVVVVVVVEHEHEHERDQEYLAEKLTALLSNSTQSVRTVRVHDVAFYIRKHLALKNVYTVFPYELGRL